MFCKDKLSRKEKRIISFIPVESLNRYGILTGHDKKQAVHAGAGIRCWRKELFEGSRYDERKSKDRFV